MAQHHDHPGTLLPQETDFDNADQPGIAQPYTQSEVEDLLYGQDRPARDRLARLHELRDEGAARESADEFGADAAGLLDEVDRAIAELSGTLDDADDGADYAGLDSALADAGGDRLDTISPDDEDAREAIEQGSAEDDTVEEEAEELDEAAEDLDGQVGPV